MNMHGIFAPVIEESVEDRPSLIARAITWLNKRRNFLLIVVLPTLLVGGYFYLIAADQYESEAHFMIRSSEGGSTAPTGFGSLLGLAGGMTQSQGEALSVADYLESHDAVAKLNHDLDLVQRFRRPEADLLSRLGTPNPTPERLLKYYKNKVLVLYNRDTGIAKLTVRAFRPDDSYEIIQRLMAMGEQRVNVLNARSYTDGIASARRQLDLAEAAVSGIQSTLTNFRQSQADIDPEGSGKAQIGLVSTLRANLAAAQSQLETMGAFVNHNSPQYVAMQRQVRSLQGQLAAQSGRLASGGSGGGASIARDLGGYEKLRLRQEFAGKRYEAAAAAFEQARDRAQRQQLYLVKVVEANRPVKSEYPERGRIVLTVFLALLLFYGIGWLLAAGVKEHAL